MRVLLTETVDPDGAMYRWLSPSLEALGHQVVVVPGQETVHHLGVSGWQTLLMAAAEALEPDLVLTHPPYDHMNASTANRLRATGARVVGFAFDDPIFLPSWRAGGGIEGVLDGIDACYDAYLTTSRSLADLSQSRRFARVAFTRWAMTPPAPTSPPDAIPARVVLIGTAYATRVALVRTLARAGLPLLVRGNGWPEAVPRLDLPAGGDVDIGGHVEAVELAALVRAGVVVSTADWESRPVSMLKLRVLEAAFAGTCQVAAACPELAEHFTADEVPGYGDAEELVALLWALMADPQRRAALARAAWTRAWVEHTWETRWPQLVAALRGLGRPVRDSRPRPFSCPGLALTTMGLATSAEFAGRATAAGAFFAHAERLGVGISATLGRARCALATGDPGLAIRLLGPALDIAQEAVQPAQRVLLSRVGSRAHGTGLGHNRLLAPHVEAYAYLVSAYAVTEQVEEARAALATLDDDAIVLVATMLRGDPLGADVYDAVFAAALAATPGELAAEQAAHAGRWQAWLTRRATPV